MPKSSQPPPGGAPGPTLEAMPRRPRLQIAGGLYHITARGVRRQEIFWDECTVCSTTIGINGQPAGWPEGAKTALDFCGGASDPRSKFRLTEFDIIAREVSGYRTRFEAIEKRLDEVEQVNARLESAALTTLRAMAEISKHWDAVYEAMRREEHPPRLNA